MADPGTPPRTWPALDLDRRPVAPADLPDLLALALDDCDATAVESDADMHWRVYFADDAARDAAGARLAGEVGAFVDIAPVDVPDEGWALKVQSTLGPVRAGGIVVAPPWSTPADDPPDLPAFEHGADPPVVGAASSAVVGVTHPPVAEPNSPPVVGTASPQAVGAASSAVVGATHPPVAGTASPQAVGAAFRRPSVRIIIEPSMGFGTGHHQSTRLCLLALQSVPVGGARVVDVGTGSGVLAIAAALLGASRIEALDNDPDAVTAARENVTRNGVAARVRVLDAEDVAASAVAPAPVVVANLTAWTLRQHADALRALVAPGGRLIVSGFTHDQVPLVVHTFDGLATVDRFEEDDWVALVLGTM